MNSFMGKIDEHYMEEIGSDLDEVFLRFYDKLEILAHEKYELTAADIKDFKSAQKTKIIERASGILTLFSEAYTTLVEEYESLIRDKYRVPSLNERKLIDLSIQKLHVKFDRLLKIIKAKFIVALEDIEDEGITFDKIDDLKIIKDISFRAIADSLVTGDYILRK